MIRDTNQMTTSEVKLGNLLSERNFGKYMLISGNKKHVNLKNTIKHFDMKSRDNLFTVSGPRNDNAKETTESEQDGEREEKVGESFCMSDRVSSVCL